MGRKIKLRIAFTEDANGVRHDVAVLKGDKGDKGDRGEQGPAYDDTELRKDVSELSSDIAQLDKTVNGTGGGTHEKVLPVSFTKNVTIDANGKQTSGSHQLVDGYFDVDNLVSVDVWPVGGESMTDKYQHGYRIYEYDADQIFLGYTKKGSNYWPLDNQRTFTPAQFAYEGTKYIRIYLNTTIDFTVTVTVEEKVEAVGGVVNQVNDLLPSIKNRLNGAVRNIAYSQIGMCPPNTEEHFLTACKLGFNALKCDVRLTSDGKLCLCHDAGFTLDADGRITTYSASNSRAIKGMTLAECKALEHATSTKDINHYAHPTDIDAFLSICKQYGMIAFITVRDEDVDETVDAVLDAVNRYNMHDVTVINNLAVIDTLRVVREKDSTIRLSYVLNHNVAATVQDVLDVAALGNAELCIFGADKNTSCWANSAAAIAKAHELGVPLQYAQTYYPADYNYYVAQGVDAVQISRPILPYKPTDYIFRINVKSGAPTLYGWITQYAPQYTADMTVTASAITISNIKLAGSNRGFADGIMDVWLNAMPYQILVSASNGKAVTAKWENNAIVIEGNYMDSALDYYVTVRV